MSLATNLVSYYKLDESSGNASDSVGSNTLTNANVTYATEKINNGAVFNGSNAQLTSASNATLSFTNNFAIAFWFKATNLSQSNVYLLNQNNQYAILWEYVNDTIEFFAGGFTGTDPRTGSGISIGDTNLHYIVYTYDGTTWEGYKDGANVFSTARTFSLASSANVFTLGSSNGANYLNGALDEVALWNRKLSSTEITTLYNGGAGNQYPFSSSAVFAPRRALLGVGI